MEEVLQQERAIGPLGVDQALRLGVEVLHRHRQLLALPLQLLQPSVARQLALLARQLQQPVVARELALQFPQPRLARELALQLFQAFGSRELAPAVARQMAPLQARV